MKRFIALSLLIVVLTLTLTGCSGVAYESGNITLGFPRLQDLNAKVTSQKIFLSKNDATLDFYYSFYGLTKINIEQAKEELSYITTYHYKEVRLECTYAIYISKNEEIVFEKNDSDELVDFKNNVNAQLYKYFSFEDAFDTDYGFSSAYGNRRIEYNHSEKITISPDLFDSSEGCIYIYVVAFVHDATNDKYYDDIVFCNPTHTCVKIKYKLIGKNTVVLVD